MKERLCAELEILEERLAGIDENIQRLFLERQALLKRTQRLKKKLCGKRQKTSPPTTVDELTICIQTKKALKGAGIYLIEELCKRTPHEIGLLKNISNKRLDELEDALEEHECFLGTS
jgi:DNA-directed RNA polymerase alpha subunit